MLSVQEKMSHAERKCRDSGARLTNKRKLILSSLLLSDKAMSAYELVDYLKNELDESIPAMSVYRILEFLQKEQFVHKLNLANKFVACSHIQCDHRHAIPQFLICCECQRVEEVNLGKITASELETNVAKAGFQLVSPQIEINCLCGDCVDAAA